MVCPPPRAPGALGFTDATSNEGFAAGGTFCDSAGTTTQADAAANNPKRRKCFTMFMWTLRWNLDVFDYKPALNENDKAFEAIEQARTQHESPLISLRVDAMFDSLRKDARFEKVLVEIGLSDKQIQERQSLIGSNYR
jgi:hypothetical protein